MHPSTLIGAVALLASGSVALPANGTPVDQAKPAPVQLIQQNVQGANVESLQPVPGDLDAATKGFLQKYQPLSDSASASIGSKTGDKFSNGGYCYAEFPCFSLDRPAIAKLGKGKGLKQQDVAGLIDQITRAPSVTFDGSHPNLVLNGLRVESADAVLEIIAPTGSMPSNNLAGMIFDMYKVQAQSGSTDAVRAIPAATDGLHSAPLALCIFPKDANAAEAANFCVGKELDGSATAATDKLATRGFSLDSLFDGFCEAISIPLLC